jgi:hypothetical protein
MPISDTYKKLLRESFKEMEASEKYSFLLWALDTAMREFYKESVATKTMHGSAGTMGEKGDP